jgi:RimJ/RimL family protein N-acetyltransferase
MTLIPTLTTARLILRPFVPEDAPAYAVLNADPDVARFITLDGKPLSPADSWRQLTFLLGHWQMRGFGMFAVAERERPDLLIGRVGPHQPEGWPDFEIGWALSRAFWGRGYASEAAAATVRYAFDVLKRPRIVSLIHPSNTRSRAVAERIGERRIGEWVLHGQTVDLYGLDRDEWRGSSNER